MNEITMPRLSDSMQEGTILSWLKSDGDRVRAGDELVEIETDKATMAYESPAEGVLTIVAAVGETLPVGAVIASVGERAEVDHEPAAEPERRRRARPPARAGHRRAGVAARASRRRARDGVGTEHRR